MRTAKILIRLGGCPGWSESSLAHSHFVGFVVLPLIYLFIPVLDVRAARPWPCISDNDCLPNKQTCENQTPKKYSACETHQCKCLDQAPECRLDPDCDTKIDCGPNKLNQEKYCHKRMCHCHKDVECTGTGASQCPTLTGCQNSVCENGHCHPTERDAKCEECLNDQHCATKSGCKPNQEKYCHKGKCHCHLDVECTGTSASQCPNLTGCPTSVCENGHCHPIKC